MARFSTIFAPELHGRLLWFGRLRWIAVCGLAVAAVTGPRLGFPAVWPSMFLVALVVAGYNICFQRLLRHPDRAESRYVGLGAVALGLMVMDLAALMVTLHYTGGLQSPLLPLFAFHMAIGTVMIRSSRMYLLAGGVSLGALALLLLELRGVLSFHPVTSQTLDPATSVLNGLAFVAGLFGIVYLTDSVASLFRRRSIELFKTTEALGRRSEELQGLLQEMKDLERRKSHYMRISAHQLRSPLGTIKTALNVLDQGYVDPASDKGRKLLNGAVAVSDSLLTVVNDLLDLAKLREGRSRAPWSREVNLNQVLADLFDMLEPEAEHREVKLVSDFEGVAILNWGVPPDLIHAFENLMSNGIKYSEPGGQLTVRLRVEGESATIEVADRGIGIPEEFIDQVFLEFVRAPNAKRFAKEGTGLGLAIAKEVIETHGGTVGAASRQGEGSTFTVRFRLDHLPPEVDPALQAGNGNGYDGHTTSPPDGPGRDRA